MSRFIFRGCLVIACVMVGFGGDVEAGEGLTFEQLAAVRSVNDVVMAPGGSFIAYTLDVPRKPGIDPDGAAGRELHVVSVEAGAEAS